MLLYFQYKGCVQRSASQAHEQTQLTALRFPFPPSSSNAACVCAPVALSSTRPYTLTLTPSLSLSRYKFVISLWRLDLAAVISAALTPLPQRNQTPLSAPRTLLLKHAATHSDGNETRMLALTRGGDRSNNSSIKGSTKYAIRGIDCVRPSFLSGRKQTSLGIIDPSCELLRPRPSRRLISGSNSNRMSEETVSDRGAGAATGSTSFGEDGDGQGNRGHLRSRRSGATCRKRRRQRKEARRLKAVAAAAASTQEEPEERTQAL